jgi:hypothetical protein
MKKGTAAGIYLESIDDEAVYVDAFSVGDHVVTLR